MADGPVFWHQGLFLQPQHFQRTDRRTEELLAGLASLTRPWLWGVRELVWDMGALATGTLRPASLRVLLPGMGTELVLPGNAACAGRVPPASLAPGESTDVYLGLAALKEGEANVTLTEDAAQEARVTTRFAVQPGANEVADLYHRGPQAGVDRLRYVLQPVFGSEKDSVRDLLLMRVARLQRTADGLKLDAAYAPPAMVLGEAPLLLALCSEVRDRVLAKTRELDSYKRLARRGNMGEMTTIFLILRSLARLAPRLQLLCERPVAHPWEACLVLHELFAELSVFSTRFNPLGEDGEGHCLLVPYEHDDPAPAFVSLRDAIVLLLDALSTGPRYLIRFENRESHQEVHLSPHIFDNPAGRNGYWASLRSASVDLGRHAGSVALAKFIPLGDMPLLLARALPGLPFSVEDQPPMGLARRADTLYLRLHTDSPLWQRVAEQGGLGLAWEEMPADLEACFIVLEE